MSLGWPGISQKHFMHSVRKCTSINTLDMRMLLRMPFARLRDGKELRVIVSLYIQAEPCCCVCICPGKEDWDHLIRTVMSCFRAFPGRIFCPDRCIDRMAVNILSVNYYFLPYNSIFASLILWKKEYWILSQPWSPEKPVRMAPNIQWSKISEAIPLKEWLFLCL